MTLALVLASLLTASPVVPQCTPEHAAMGHCKLAPPPAAKPKAKPAPRPKATPKPKPKPKPGPSARSKPKATPKPAPAPAPPAPPPTAQCTPEHAAMGHCKAAPPAAEAPPSDAAPPEPPRSPPVASTPEHAADSIWGAAEMAHARHAVHAEHGDFRGRKIALDRLEYRATDGYAWQGQAWFGGDYDKLWFKSEGEGEFGGSLHFAEAQALFSRAIDPWFDVQAGVRQDFGRGPDRTHLAIGIHGLAPYWFEVEAAAFLSTKGDLTARVEAEYDQRLTPRLILQPRIELDLAAQDVRELGIGTGLSSIEAGLRLRYEMVPEFAPYLGVEYERAIGRTADFARASGEDTGGWAFVVGVRAWF